MWKQSKQWYECTMQNKSSDIQVLLSIGANLGNKQMNINRAISLMAESGVMRNIKRASFYETEPVGFKEQPWFVNTAIHAVTSYPLNYIIQFCKSIEYSLGRTVRERWHEREIDIDILLYGDRVINSHTLTVPHPRMHERRFVLVPANEIAATTMHPSLGLTIRELLRQCPDSSEVRCAMETVGND